jgi:hypothetical protein
VDVFVIVTCFVTGCPEIGSVPKSVTAGAEKFTDETSVPVRFTVRAVGGAVDDWLARLKVHCPRLVPLAVGENVIGTLRVWPATSD